MQEFKEHFDAGKAYRYAHDILGKKYKEGENAISKNCYFSYNYALNVLHGRFKQAEKMLNKDPIYSKLYKTNIYDKEIKHLQNLMETTTITNCILTLEV